MHDAVVIIRRIERVHSLPRLFEECVFPACDRRRSKLILNNPLRRNADTSSVSWAKWASFSSLLRESEHLITIQLFLKVRVVMTELISKILWKRENITEFISSTSVHVFPNYLHVLVSVGSALFVPKSNHVTKLMCHHVMVLAPESDRHFPAFISSLAYCAVTTGCRSREGCKTKSNIKSRKDVRISNNNSIKRLLELKHGHKHFDPKKTIFLTEFLERNWRNPSRWFFR